MCKLAGCGWPSASFLTEFGGSFLPVFLVVVVAVVAISSTATDVLEIPCNVTISLGSSPKKFSADSPL